MEYRGNCIDCVQLASDWWLARWRHRSAILKKANTRGPRRRSGALHGQTREFPVFYVWPAECGVSVISAFGSGRRHFSHPENKKKTVECVCVWVCGGAKEGISRAALKKVRHFEFPNALVLSLFSFNLVDQKDPKLVICVSTLKVKKRHTEFCV
jgi:hypothetical protein